MKKEIKQNIKFGFNVMAGIFIILLAVTVIYFFATTIFNFMK